MKTIGGATKVLGDMAGGKVAFDAAAAEAAKAALVAASLDIEAKFTPTTTDPGQAAKPEVWTNWADFLIKAKGLTGAATALDATSVAGVGAGMEALGGACHKAYHIKLEQKPARRQPQVTDVIRPFAFSMKFARVAEYSSVTG